MKLAEVLEAMNRREAAAETYAALLERHPRHHEGQYRLGKLYMALGEPALAAVQFDRATHSDAKDPRPYNALGILRDQAGEHEAAQAFYRSALERSEEHTSELQSLLSRSSAVFCLQKTIETLSNNPDEQHLKQ